MMRNKIGLFIITYFTLTLHINAQRVYYPVGSLGEYETIRAAILNPWEYKFHHKEQAYYRHFDFLKTDTSKDIRMIEVVKAENNYSLDSFKSDTSPNRYGCILGYKSYLYDDNINRRRLFKRYTDKNLTFYNYIGAFYSQKKEDYLFVVNPVINFWGAKESATNRTLYQNTRGAEVWGNIGGKTKGVGFYTYFTDNQMVMPQQYISLPDSLNFVPNELFFKKFKNTTGVDYFQARGYVTFNAANQHINFQFGHDKNKIGNGYRSLILSDFAPQYLFLKINTNVGKVHYQNLFTQFSDNGQILGNTLFGKKYAAFHRLSVDVTRNLSIGVNEMVIFDRHDSTQSNQFDFNYLNPVIFYRAVESNLGSRDNSLMALDFNYTLHNRYLFYGQFLLDEFKLSELKNNKNWWGNKYGYQIGVRAFDFLRIKRLDVLLEYNRVRPYTYSHYRTTQSYSQFNQPLAHPLGANFGEGVFEIKYKPSYKWYLTLTGIYAKQGKDSFLLGRNYGSNILRSYETRATSDNSKMFMGHTQNLVIAELMVSYMFKHNLFIDVRCNYRSSGSFNNSFYGMGLRLNCNVRQSNF